MNIPKRASCHQAVRFARWALVSFEKSRGAELAHAAIGIVTASVRTMLKEGRVVFIALFAFGFTWEKPGIH
jgi:hypothetical protein